MAYMLNYWSELGEDLLLRIGQRLIALDDVIRSRAVCNPWRRALESEQQRRCPPSTQWLMLPYCTSNNMNMNTPIRSSSSSTSSLAMPSTGCKGSQSCRCFYDVVLHQFHHIEFPQHLRNKTCRGSSMGWLCMVGRTPAMYLFNPVTKTEIPLPPITSFPDVLAYSPEKPRLEYLLRDPGGFTASQGKKYMENIYIMRVAVSAEPTSKECIVVAMRCNTDHRLAFCRPAEIEAGWMFVPHVKEDGIPSRIGYGDVVFWRDQLYAVESGGNLLVCDFSADPHYPALSYSLPRHFHSVAVNRYLVVSPATVTGGDDDELMMVARQADFFPNHDHGNDDPVAADDDCHANAADDYHASAAEDDDEDDLHFDVPDSDSDDEQLGTGTGAVVASKPYWTEEFEVYKLNRGAQKWEKVESIGDFALFLGFNTPSTFVSVKDHPGLMPNSIYFTDNMWEYHYHPHWKRRGNYDMGIYDLATHAIHPLYSTTSLHDDPLWISPLPMWLSPSSSVISS